MDAGRHQQDGLLVRGPADGKIRCPGRSPPRCRRSGRKARRCPVPRLVPGGGRAEVARPASDGRASSTAAALLDPPPSPPPIGMLLVRRKRIARVHLHGIERGAGGARRTRLSGIASGSSSSSTVRRAGSIFDVDGVGQRDGLENGAQFMEAVGAFVKHAQIQIDLGQRPQTRPAGSSASNAPATARRGPAIFRGRSGNPVR